MSILDQIQPLLPGLLDTAEIHAHLRPLSLKCDTYVARSILQKAIRRGETALALRAASTLAQTDIKIAWRRLLVTLLEDVGIHQYSLILACASAQESRRFGIKIDDDWPILAAIISSACTSIKCQAANELQNLALYHPLYDSERSLTARRPREHLLAMIADRSNSPVQRQIAVLACMGRDHARWSVGSRLASNSEIVRAIADDEVSEIYVWAALRTGLALAPASLILLTDRAAHAALTCGATDPIHPTRWRHDVPMYALDQYTRIGKAAIRDFVGTNSDWQRFAKEMELSRSQQIEAYGELIFRIDSAPLNLRRDWPLGNFLAWESRNAGCHLPIEAVDEARRIATDQLSSLNELRVLRFDAWLAAPQ